MRTRHAMIGLFALLTSLALTPPAAAHGRGWRTEGTAAPYDGAYRLGYNDGSKDARQGRVYDFNRLRRGSDEFRRGGYQDPAFSRGLSEGYRRGYEDGRNRDRYDPVRHGEYRSGDNGYFGGYGARDVYRNNYRDGFRQGYEDGYRQATHSRR